MEVNAIVPTVSVVIPCYRSERTLTELVDRIHATLEDLDYEVILVVDGSPDETWNMVRRLSEHERVRGIELMRNYGQHNAVLAGIVDAQKSIIVTMDDDLQHPPEAIPELVAQLRHGADLAYGVPNREEHGFWRSLASKSVKAAMAVTLGVEHATRISAFRAFRRELSDPLSELADAFVSIDVCLSWATSRVAAVTVSMSKRADGESNYTVRALMAHAFNMVTGYSDRPLRIMTLLGLATSLLGFSLFVYVLVLFFSGTTEVPGFTTIAAMVALFSGAQMLAMGIMGEYIGRLHFRSMRRPTFVIRQRAGDDSTP